MFDLPAYARLSADKKLLFFTTPDTWQPRNLISITTNFFGSTDYNDRYQENLANTRLLETFNLDTLHKLKVRHGYQIETIIGDPNYSGIHHHEVDALVYKNLRHKRIMLGSNTADCPIVFLTDIHNRYYAVIHSGWRSAASNIVGKTIAKLELLGIKPHLLRAWVWPGIKGVDYSVGEDVKKSFHKKYTLDDKLSLREVIFDQLTEYLTTDNIFIAKDFHSNLKYQDIKLYSHRRGCDERNFIFILTNDFL